jgi:hypothetical protein
LTHEYADLKKASSSSSSSLPEEGVNKKYPPNKDDDEETGLGGESSNNGQKMENKTQENGYVRGGEILLRPNNSEIERSASTSKKYSDFLIDGVPIWEVEHRGVTEEEALSFKERSRRTQEG